MNDVREIVTRAVLAKGRKILKLKETVLLTNDVSSILGCWIINHQFTTTLDGKEVIVTLKCCLVRHSPWRWMG